MSEVPPSQDPLDDVDESYRRASALDPSRPSESVRRAVLAYATHLAAERVVKAELAHINVDSVPRVANQSWWRPAIFGTLSAAAVAGLLVVPHLLPSSGGSGLPGVAAPPPASSPTAPAAAPAPPTASAPQSASSSASATTPAPALLPAEATAQAGLPASTPSGAATPAAKANTTFANQSIAPAAVSPSSPATANADAATLQEVVVTGARRTANDNQASAAPIASVAASDVLASKGRAQAPPGAAEAFRHAAETGDLHKLKTSLAEQVDVNSRDAAGRTALLLATMHGQTKAVKLLLSRSADPNVADTNGVTPLQAAMDGGQTAIVAALEHAGAR